MKNLITFFHQLQNLFLIATSNLFDKNWYLKNNRYLADASENPLANYLEHGGFEGRDPSPDFDSDWYLKTYPDVEASGINPLVHYLRFGKKEGRSLKHIQKNIPNSSSGASPDFLIIGAQKAGTSALFSILAQHPQVIAPEVKEMHFFDAASANYGDFSAYHALFPARQDLLPDKLTFEASPSYLYQPQSPARIIRYSEKMRIIAILRNPVERAFSAWNMYHRFQHLETAHPFHALADSRGFEDAVLEELENIDERDWQSDPIAYVKRGIYVNQLNRYYKYFPREQVLVLDYVELLNQPGLALEKVCSFLQIDEQFDFDAIRANVSTYETMISSKTRDLLNAFYAPYNRKLFQLLGVDFHW